MSICTIILGILGILYIIASFVTGEIFIDNAGSKIMFVVNVFLVILYITLDLCGYL